MHPAPDQPGTTLAAAETLRAARAVARALLSPSCDPLRPNFGTDQSLDGLARWLSGSAALTEDVASGVETLLARCDALVEAETGTSVEWMPKAVCGDDVTEWEPWNRPERTPEAEALLLVAEDLRRYLARRANVADLVSAEAALGVLRKGRAEE